MRGLNIGCNASERRAIEVVPRNGLDCLADSPSGNGNLSALELNVNVANLRALLGAEGPR